MHNVVYCYTAWHIKNLRRLQLIKVCIIPVVPSSSAQRGILLYSPGRPIYSEARSHHLGKLYVRPVVSCHCEAMSQMAIAEVEWQNYLDHHRENDLEMIQTHWLPSVLPLVPPPQLHSKLDKNRARNVVKKRDDQRMQKSRDDKQMKCKGGPDPEENNCDYKTEAKDKDDDEDTTNVIGVQLGPILVQLSSRPDRMFIQ